MQSGSFFSLVVLATVCAIAGCNAAPVISVDALADPEHAFATPSEVAAEVVIWRFSESDRVARDAADADSSAVAPDESDVDEAGDAWSAGGRAVSPAERTLEERNLFAGVRAGLQQAGFRVGETAAISPGAVYQFLASIETVTGEYDTYRRVPVFESDWGHVHTRKGLRHYHGTRSTEVIVPERRRFVHRIVTLTALPAESREVAPTSPSVVWRGRVIGDAEIIDADLPAHLGTLLEDWGRTTNRTVEYTPDPATESSEARGER